MNVDFEKILNAMIGHSSLDEFSIHGPDHWNRVKHNGLQLAKRNGADETVVTLFALFHDAERWNDGHDPEHGQRAAKLVQRLHGDLFQIDQNSLELLSVACEFHHQGATTDDLTVGTCWDADRMDLTRVGAVPRPELMSTEVGKSFARLGRFDDAIQEGNQ